MGTGHRTGSSAEEVTTAERREIRPRIVRTVRGSFFVMYPIGPPAKAPDPHRIFPPLFAIIASSVNTMFTYSGSRGDLPPVR